MATTTAISTDPLVFARDENNDLIIPLRKASGLEAIAIFVRTAWLLFRDELAINRDIGTPWLETEDRIVTERDAILGQPYDAAKINRALRGEALAIPGVSDVTEFKSSFDSDRNVTVSAVVHALFADGVTGTVPVAIAVGGG